jgi:hypothetical protein
LELAWSLLYCTAMRNTDFSIIDPGALGTVIGGCKPKMAPQPQPQQAAAMGPAPEEDECTVEVATGAQAAQRIGAMTGQQQPGAIQAPRMI